MGAYLAGWLASGLGLVGHMYTSTLSSWLSRALHRIPSLTRSVLTITRPRLRESLLCLLLLLASDGFGLVELGAYRCIAR